MSSKSFFSEPPNDIDKEMNNIQDVISPLLLSNDSRASEGDLVRVEITNTPTKNDLGVFMGVFVPCMLSIFGVVLFERLSWMLGQAGLIETLAMFFLAYLVVSLTTLSLSAIATNGTIKGGGAYYMISRCLGPEFGGSIGVIFYLANVVGGASYLLGFASALKNSDSHVPGTHWEVISFAIGALIIFTIISFVGAGVFAKTFIVIFAALGVAVAVAWISLVTNRDPFTTHNNDTYTGWNITTFKSNIAPHYVSLPEGAGKQSFNTVFAIFFPSVTGIMAGANMSGDLKNPGKSIPKGTILAIVTSFIVYTILIVTLAFTVERKSLQNDYFLLSTLAYNKWLVYQGIFCATLSSALGSIIGGSRILQALARDELLPIGFFAKGTVKGDEPRRAVLLTAVLIFGVILIGDLNIVLPIVSMFFFLTYGLTNFACFLLSISGAPNFRPLFSFYTWWSSGIGAILCIAAMFYLEPLYAGISIIFFLILFAFIHLYSKPQQWGDIAQAIIFHQVRKYLLRLQPQQHVKNWRPSILILVNDIPGSLSLIDFGNSIKKGGLYIIGSVLHQSDTPVKEWTAFQKNLDNFTRTSHLKAFCEVVQSSTYRLGANNLIMTAGIGGMKPNIVMMTFNGLSERGVLFASAKEEKLGDSFDIDVLENTIDVLNIKKEPLYLSCSEFTSLVRDTITIGKNVLLARNFEKMSKHHIIGYSMLNSSLTKKKGNKFTIDLWMTAFLKDNQWESECDWMDEAFIEESPELLLTIQLGYILSRANIWKKYSELRINALVELEEDQQKVKTKLQEMLVRMRISSQLFVIPVASGGLSSYKIAKAQQRFGEEHILASLPPTKLYPILNEAIKKESRKTGVLFVPFHPPPSGSSDDERYCKDLDALSRDLPPTILVYAVENMIATEL